MNVDTAKIRQFINDHFGPEDLRTFLFDYFRPVYDDLTDGLAKSRQIALLLEYCHQHQKFPDLLAAVQRERSFFQPNDYVQGQKAPTAAQPTPAPITRNPRQIFISHAHQDAEVAQRLAHDLEAHGYDIWIAPDSIQPGEKWVEAINRGLEESGIFVLLLSPDAVASRWVQMETNVAISYVHEDEMELYPLMLKACHLPALWRAFQHISLRGGYERGIESLLLALEPEEPLSRISGGVGLKGNLSLRVFRNSLPSFGTSENEIVWQKTGQELVKIPAGSFLYGDKKENVYLDEFWISRTPVTNAEYKRFIDANPGYEVPFVDQDWANPYNWNVRHRTYPADKADRPVVLVSWHDAMAYTTWGNLELPTEQQWEKAVRGTDGRIYPWGNEWKANHCNTRETGILETTPVGQFSPYGDSFYGCVDMIGNVWEWTSSKWQQGSSLNIRRGGSWGTDRSEAFTSFRGANRARNRFGGIGFRVLLNGTHS